VESVVEDDSRLPFDLSAVASAKAEALANEGAIRGKNQREILSRPVPA
jgi:hypothetical protein